MAKRKNTNKNKTLDQATSSSEESKPTITPIYNTFEEGEIIYRQGDIGIASFVVVEGHVELTRTGKHGNVRLAILNRGDLFGDHEVLTGTKRLATAITKSRVKLRWIPSQDFIHVLAENAESLPIHMSKFIAKVTKGDQKTLKGLEGEAVLPILLDQKESKIKFINKLKTNTNKRMAPIEIIITHLNGDKDGRLTNQFLNVLNRTVRNSEIFKNSEKEALIRFRLLSPAEFSYTIDPDNEIGSIDLACSSARMILNKYDADLLLWGEINEKESAIIVKFANKLPDFGIRPGIMHALHSLPLMTEFNEKDVVLMTLAIASMVHLKNKEAQEHCYKVVLVLIEQLHEIVKKPAFKKVLKSQLLSVVSAILGWRVITSNLDEKLGATASKALDDALREANSNNDAFTGAILLRQRAEMSLYAGKNTGNVLQIKEAIFDFEDTLHYFTREYSPSDWGNIQSRIGDAYVIVDKLQVHNGDNYSDIESAIDHYKNSLEIILVGNLPTRWADIKYSLTKALMTLGRERRSVSTYAEAITQAKDALKIRNRTTSPLSWANLQNSIGSSYFYLAQMIKRDDIAIMARNRFLNAREIFEQMGDRKLINIVEKNIVKVSRFLNESPIKFGIKRTVQLNEDIEKNPLVKISREARSQLQNQHNQDKTE